MTLIVTIKDIIAIGLLVLCGAALVVLLAIDRIDAAIQKWKEKRREKHE